MKNSEFRSTVYNLWNQSLSAGVRTSVLLLKALHIILRAFLVLACAFWLLIVVDLLPAVITGGTDGVRVRLLEIWSIGRINPAWSCQDSLQLLHEGYADVILFLLLTWAALELKRFLYRRMLTRSRQGAVPQAS